MKPKNPLPTVNFFTKATASVLVFAITMQSCVLQSASTNMDFKDDISDDAITHTDVKHVASSRLELGPLNASRNRVSRQSASASSNSSGSSLLVKSGLIALGLVVGGGAAFGGTYAYYKKVVNDYEADLSQANNAFHTCNSELNGYVVKNTRLLQTGNSPTYSYRPGCKDRLYGFFDPTTNAHIFGYKSLSDGNNTFIPNATTVSPLYQNASEVVTPEGSLNKLYGTSGCESALKSLIETSTSAQSYTNCMNDLYGTGPTGPGCKNLLKTNTSGYPWGTPPIGCQDSLNTSQVSYNSCSNQLATSQTSNLNLTSLYNTCNSSLNTLNAALLSCQQSQPAVDCAAQFGTSCSACISNVTCTNCTTGLYPKSGNPGCATCASLYSNCASCTTNLVGATSCATCNAGYYLNGTNCNTCATGCNACTSATLCTSCSTNLFLSNSSCVNCGAAIANCASCTKTTTGTASCNACTAGYYSTGTSCSTCLTGCATCSSSTVCTSCATNLYLSNGGCMGCSTAIPNCTTCTASSTGTAICSACTAGYSAQNNGASCVYTTTNNPSSTGKINTYIYQDYSSTGNGGLLTLGQIANMICIQGDQSCKGGIILGFLNFTQLSDGSYQAGLMYNTVPAYSSTTSPQADFTLCPGAKDLMWKDYITMREKYPNLGVGLSIGGSAAGSLSLPVEGSTAFNKTVQSLTNFFTTYSPMFSILDIDVESKFNGTRMSSLLKAVKQQHPWLTLTAAPQFGTPTSTSIVLVSEGYYTDYDPMIQDGILSKILGQFYNNPGYVYNGTIQAQPSSIPALFSYFNNNANVGSKLALGIPANSDSTFAGNSASPFARSGISATQAASEIIGNFTSTAHRDLMIWSANEAAKGNCELMKRIALFNNGTIVCPGETAFSGSTYFYTGNFSIWSGTYCNPCNPGYDSAPWCSNTTNTSCPSNCSTCSSTTTCTSCNPGYTLNSGTCSPTVTCPSNCSTCSSSTTCTACNTGYNLSSGSCMASCTGLANCSTCSSPTTCTGCATGYSLSSGSCIANCSSLANCSACSSPTTCTGCATGYSLSSGSCIANCSGLANCSACSSPTTCTGCATGYTLNSGTCTASPNYSKQMSVYYCLSNCNNASSIANIHPNATSVTIELATITNGATYFMNIPPAMSTTSSQVKGLGKKVGLSVSGDLTKVLTSPSVFINNITSAVSANNLDKIDIELTLGNGTATNACSMFSTLRASLPNATEIEITIDPTGVAKVGGAIPEASTNSPLAGWNKAASIINCGIPYINRVNLRLYTPYSGANMTQMILDLNNWNNASFATSSFAGVPSSKMGLIFLAHNSTEAARVWSASSYNYTDATSLINFINGLNATYGIKPSSLLVQGATFDAINNRTITNAVATLL